MESSFICPARKITDDEADGPPRDTWVEGYAGARCSYCLCLEPSFFLSLCDRAAEGRDGIEVEITTRRGSYVVRRPGVAPAGFTTRHLRDRDEPEMIDAIVRIRRAVRETEQRFWESTRADLGMPSGLPPSPRGSV